MDPVAAFPTTCPRSSGPVAKVGLGDKLVAAAKFDYELKQTLQVRIRVTDQGGLLLEKAFEVRVADVTELPPSITSISPIEAIGTNSVSAIFTVAVSGDGSRQYQWYSGESGDTTTPLNGATGSSLEIANVSRQGAYWVRVANEYGAADSATARVIVFRSPEVLVQPQDVNVGKGLSTSLLVDADGTPPLQFQWYLGSDLQSRSIILGATNTSFNTSPESLGTNVYSVEIVNAFGRVNSSFTQVATVDHPRISSQRSPSGLITLTATCRYTSRWEFQSSLNLKEWTAIPGIEVIELKDGTQKTITIDSDLRPGVQEYYRLKAVFD